MVPKVSVIIPFYNNVSWLFEAVDSVLLQDYPSYEIIVVNDGSVEDMSAFLDVYDDKVKYYCKENGGAASARNYGILKAQGEYIAFLDSDDIWRPNKLSIQLLKMVEYNAGWSCTDYETFGNGIKKRKKSMGYRSEGLYKNESPYIATPTVIIKKSLLTEFGVKFDEELQYGEDSCFWAQLYNISPVLYLSQILSMVRIRGKNASKRAAVQLTARIKVYEKCVETVPGYKNSKSRLYRMAIALCKFSCRFIDVDKLDESITEVKARLLYLVPYLLFKIDGFVKMGLL